MRGERVKGIRLVWATAAFAACAHSIPEAPTPVVIDARPEGPAAEPIRSVEHDAPVFRRPPGPPLPLPDVPVRLDPARPLQAGAVVVRVRQPAGPALESPSLAVAGRPVVLAPSTDGWVGIAALPLDSAGYQPVELVYRRAGRSEEKTFVVPVIPRVYPSTRIRISGGRRWDPEVDARIARERALIDEALRSSGPEWLPREPFEWPRPAVRTSPFGQRRTFNGNLASRHMGLDLRGRSGEPVRAPAAGLVVLTGNFYYQGNAVYLDHGLGVVSAYFHFSRTDVEMGDLVEAGQVIGAVGSTGRSTAPHLHWSAYVGGTNIDPESLIGLTLFPVDERASTSPGFEDPPGLAPPPTGGDAPGPMSRP